ADLPGIEKLWYQRLETFPAAKPPKMVRTTQTPMTSMRWRETEWARRASTDLPSVSFFDPHKLQGLKLCCNCKVRYDRCDGSARVEEAPSPKGDRRLRDAALRAARLRPRHGRRGCRRGRRLREDRLQLLPHEGGPLLRRSAGTRGRARRRDSRPPRG